MQAGSRVMKVTVTGRLERSAPQLPFRSIFKQNQNILSLDNTLITEGYFVLIISPLNLSKQCSQGKKITNSRIKLLTNSVISSVYIISITIDRNFKNLYYITAHHFACQRTSYFRYFLTKKNQFNN